MLTDLAKFIVEYISDNNDYVQKENMKINIEDLDEFDSKEYLVDEETIKIYFSDIVETNNLELIEKAKTTVALARQINLIKRR